MDNVLRLSEYVSQPVRLSQARAKRLNDTGYLSVVPDANSGWWQVVAGHHVGTLVVDDLHIHVRPKIKLENLFLLLSVGLKEKVWRRPAARYANDNDLLPAVISFFTRMVDATLARGMYRSYREERERLYTVRGRIDIPAQITRAGAVHPVDCRFSEFTPDANENRYLKAAVRTALRVPRVRPEDRRRLYRTLVTFEGVRDVFVWPEALDRIGFNRLNNHYEPALRLARILLENLTLKDERGETVASSFMVDMNLLFERFVTDRLQRALRGRLKVKPQRLAHLDQADRVRIRPDLVFRRVGEEVLVGDLKYKWVGELSGLPTSDHYQLLAYTTALDLAEGVLIYCRDSDKDGTQHDSITVRNAEKVLHTWGIDMSGPPADVEAEIEQLADWIAERAKQAEPVVRSALSGAS